MRFLFLLSVIFLLGAACSTPTTVQQVPKQQEVSLKQSSSYDLFFDDVPFFLEKEDFPIDLSTSSPLLIPTNTPTQTVSKNEPKNKKSPHQEIVIVPKKEEVPLPPKTFSPKKIEGVENKEETIEDDEHVYSEDEEETSIESDSSELSCEPEWECSEWSACTASGKRTYSCTDLNECAEDYVGTESCKAPSKLTRGPYNVAITGSNTECKNNTVKAINLLKTMPSFYKFFITYIGEVNCIPQASRMDVYKDPPRFEVGYVTAAGGDIWYASVLVHEACHSKQYRDYVYTHNSFNVPQDLYFGYTAEYQCNQEQKKALIALGAEQYLIDSMDDMSSEWWKLSEQEQTW